MSEQQPTPHETAPRDLDYAGASLAYSIIQSLLEHTRITSDLVALMAQALGEETAEALTHTPYWSAYLDSRRTMERTRKQIEEFTELMSRLTEESEN